MRTINMKESLFKIIYTQRDVVHEIYAEQVSESDMYGFIVVEDLFYDEQLELLPETAEEKPRFAEEVQRTYIPIHAVIRIDEIQRKINTTKPVHTNNIRIFPNQNNKIEEV